MVKCTVYSLHPFVCWVRLFCTIKPLNPDQLMIKDIYCNMYLYIYIYIYMNGRYRRNPPSRISSYMLCCSVVCLNSLWSNNTIWCHRTWSILVQVIRLVACSVPSHYWNQCRLNVNWTVRNKLQWNLYQNAKCFVNEKFLKMSSANCEQLCFRLNMLVMT